MLSPLRWYRQRKYLVDIYTNIRVLFLLIGDDALGQQLDESQLVKECARKFFDEGRNAYEGALLTGAKFLEGVIGATLDEAGKAKLNTELVQLYTGVADVEFITETASFFTLRFAWAEGRADEWVKEGKASTDARWAFVWVLQQALGGIAASPEELTTLPQEYRQGLLLRLKWAKEGKASRVASRSEAALDQEVDAVRAAEKAGRSTGRQWGDQIEANWIQMKEGAEEYLDSPAALKAMFLGWMQQLHAEMVDMFSALNASDAEVHQNWLALTTHFANRFRSEVLTASHASETNQILSDNDIARIAADVDGVANDFKHSVEADREAALNQAANGVRAAEEAGRLARDPRSDRELKESIRKMWDEEPNERAQ